MPRMTPLTWLLAALLLIPTLGAQELEGKGFQYTLSENTDLVAWRDADFPGGLLGGKRWVKGDGVAAPGEVVRGIHVGPFGFLDEGEPSWQDDIEYSVRWEPTDKLHCLNLVITGRNKTKKRISFQKNPLAVWMGPMGSDDTGRYALLEVKGFDGRDIVTLETGPADPALRWVGLTDRYRAMVIEKIEGPGRFRYETLPTVAPAPEGEEPSQYPGKFLVLQLFDELQIEEEFEVKIRVFAGLKRQEILREAGYLGLFDTWGGWFGWIAYLAFVVLAMFHDLTNSWGIAIILLTVAMKLVLHPLSRKQFESMDKMKELQPRMQGLQTRYANNPERMQAEVAKLWAEAGVNPLSGCLPLIMQMPIFIALYNCLGYAPELRGVEFLWLPDLSQADPLWLLPFLFALGIYVSSSQSQSGGDPSQKMMMQVMPLIMFFIMRGLPSGVMVYLAGQVLLSVVEQKIIRSGAANKKPTEGKAGPAGDAAGEDRVIDNDAAGEAREAAEEKRPTGNKYKQARKNRK